MEIEPFLTKVVKFNLKDNRYQQKSEVLYFFTPNKSYAYLLNFDASSLMFLKTYNTEFDEIIITFTNQKVYLTLLVNR